MKTDAVQAEIYLVPLAAGGARTPTAAVRAAPSPLALCALAFSVSLGCATAPGVRVHHLSRVPIEGEVSTVDTNALAVGSMGTVHVRGLTANARSELLTWQGYSVCDPDASACDPGTGVEFIEDTSIPSDGNGLYRAELTYEVPPTAAHPQVVPISFLDKQISTGGSDDVVRPLDYQVPIRNVTQVTNNLSINGTAADQEETDVRFGEITFLPPDFTKAYALIRGGILAVVDTTTDEGQQPAEIDLAVTNNGATTASQRMSILKGLGDLDFQLQGQSDPGSAPKGIAKGDFDHDGDLDLAIAASGSGLVSIFRGNGTGGLAWVRNETVGTGPSAIVAEDFDLDGNLDLAVVRDGGGSPECSVVVLRGLGDSDFHDTELVFTVGDSGSAGDFPTGIAAANFDPNTDPANTLPDILVSMYDRSTDAGKVVMLVNVSPEPGTIDFDDASLVSASVGDRPMGIALGDFTGDGALDAITADYLDDQISVVEGTGDGDFEAPPTTFATHDGPTAVVAGHLNPGEDSGLDTYLDVVTANDGAGTDDITVFLGDGAGGTLGGGLGINHYSLNGGSGPTAIALGEFNLDTAIDIVVGNSGSDDLSLFAGDGDGSFGTAEVGSFGANIANPWAFAVGEWKTQTEDVLYLGDRNVGYGIEIIEYPAASGEYYAFLTNDTQDSDPGLSTSCDDGESAFTDSEGKFVSNTVQVVKIDTGAFPPTNESTANDRLVATLEVGCSPQGIDSYQLAGEVAAVFVSNAFDATISRIDVAELLDNALPDDPVAIHPDNSAIVTTQALLPPSPVDLQSQRGQLINRDLIVAPVQDYAASGHPDEDWVLVTVGDPAADTPGWIAVIDPDDLDSQTFLGAHPSTDGEGNVGGFPVGLARLPHPLTIPTETDPLLATRIVVASDKVWSLSGFSDRDEVGIVGIVNPANAIAGGGSVVELAGSNGTVSGSIAVSASGRQAYVARIDASDPPVDDGVVVIDTNPGSFPAYPPNRLIGSLGGDKGVFSVARLGGDDFDFEGANGKDHKLYQGSVFEDGEADPPVDLRGVWVMPEPLVVPFQSFRAEAGTLDSSFELTAQADLLGRTHLAQQPKARLGDGKLVYTAVDVDAEDPEATARIVVTDADGTNEIVVTDPSVTGQGRALVPAWSPDADTDPDSRIVFHASQGSAPDIIVVDFENGGPDPEDYEWINLMDYDGVDTGNAADVDPHWIYDPEAPQNRPNQMAIVFVRSEAGTADCAGVPLGRVYRMRWDPDEDDPEEAIRELPVALTDPDSDPTIQAACETWESGDVQLGDYDPEISPSPVKVRSDDTARMRVAFARRFDQVNLSVNSNHTAFGDWDILVVDLEETTPEASVENITDWKDSGSTIYADQIPSWKDHSGVTDLTHRLAFSSVSSVPQDDRDIFTAAARTDVQDYVNAQPCGSGSGEPSCTEVDSYWDSAPTWIPARAEGSTESLPDLTFHRFDVGPGQYTGSLLNLLGFH